MTPVHVRQAAGWFLRSAANLKPDAMARHASICPVWNGLERLRR